MQYLHTMIRVGDLQAALNFYCNGLGLVEVYRKDVPEGKYTLVFLTAPDDVATYQETKAPAIELTYNWDESNYSGGRNFGHLAFAVDDIYALCTKLQQQGITINRPPRDGRMAFVKSPDNISIELLQKNKPLAPAEPWVSMPNTGSW